jgi:hypothetical protein
MPNPLFYDDLNNLNYAFRSFEYEMRLKTNNGDIITIISNLITYYGFSFHDLKEMFKEYYPEYLPKLQTFLLLK